MGTHTRLKRERAWQHAATAVVVLLAAYAAFHRLGYRSLWYDEVRTLQVYAAHPFNLRNGDPPLYPLYVRAVGWLTTSELWLRLPNALGLVIIAGVVSGVWRRWLHPIACVAAGAACATSVALLTSGQMVRPYGINVACTLLAYSSFLRLLETASWWWALAYVAAAVAALYTHYSAVLMCGVHAVCGAIWLVVHPRSRWRTFTCGVIAAALVGMFIAPWYIPLYRNLGALLASTPAPRQAVTLIAFARLVTRELFQGLSFGLVLACMLLGTLLMLARRTRFPVLVLMVWLLSGFLFVYHQTTGRGMFLASRYYLFFLPPAYLLAASGVAEAISLVARRWGAHLTKCWETAVIFFVWGCLWWPSLSAWYAYQRYYRNTDSRQVATLSLHLQRHGTPVIYNGWHLAFTHYPHALQRGDPHQALTQAEPVFYLTDRPAEVFIGSQFAAYDAVHLPYEGTPHVFALFRQRTPLTNYVKRAAAVLREALTLDPRHAQMKELLEGLEEVAGNRLSARKYAPRHGRGTVYVLQPHTWEGLCGWGALERWPDGTSLRWTVGRVAALRLPRRHGVPRALTVRACAFLPPGRDSQAVTAWLNGFCLGTRALTAAWQELHWRVNLSRNASDAYTLAFDIHTPCPPSAVGLGNDSRPLGIAVSELRVQHLPPLRTPTLQIGDETHAAYLDEGWSHCETWPSFGGFRWITGFVARITWCEEGPLAAGVWHVHMMPFVMTTMSQKVAIWQDDVLLTNFVLAPAWSSYSIISPASRSHSAQLSFVFAHAWRPHELGINDDARLLAAAVATVRRETPRQRR